MCKLIPAQGREGPRRIGRHHCRKELVRTAQDYQQRLEQDDDHRSEEHPEIRQGQRRR